MVITYQILGKAKNKDILAPEIETMKEQLSKLLKKIQAIQKKIENMEPLITGYSHKEIETFKKYAGGRKPDPEIVAKSKLYLIDPSKVVKDDKTVKPAKTKWMRKGKKKKPEESLFTSDMTSSIGQNELMEVKIGEDGLPINEADIEEDGEGE